MDPARLLRAARQQAELSQRALAQRAGVHQTVVARIEAGKARPSWDTVLRLLTAADRSVALALPEPEPDERQRRWLHQSTARRLYLSLGGRLHHQADRRDGPWTALGALARGRTVLLAPEASLGVWLPDRPAPLPLPVTLIAARDVWGGLPMHSPYLAVGVGPLSLRGLVPVGVSARYEVYVHPPESPMFPTDALTRAQLAATATLLHAEQRRDRAQRFPAAHKDSRVQAEFDYVMARRRFVGRHDPDPRERRDWRLDGAASFREWLLRNGYPVRDRERPDPDDEDEPGRLTG